MDDNTLLRLERLPSRQEREPLDSAVPNHLCGRCYGTGCRPDLSRKCRTCAGSGKVTDLRKAYITEASVQTVEFAKNVFFRRRNAADLAETHVALDAFISETTSQRLFHAALYVVRFADAVITRRAQAYIEGALPSKQAMLFKHACYNAHKFIESLMSMA